MPIYEYRCTRCGDQIEVIQKLSDRPLRACRSCKGRLEKLISRSAFLLKGGGWYSEGYSKGSSKATPSAPAKASKKGKSESSSSGSGAKAASTGT